MEAKRASVVHSLDSEIATLFDGTQASGEVVPQFLNYLHANLVTTEKAIGSDFTRMTLAFLAFLFLDSGLVTEVTLAGAKVTKSGLLLLMFPLLITFLNYQAWGRLGLAHELRTALALLYRRLCPPIYRHGLDLLTHYPSLRNFETYDSKVLDGRSARVVSMCSTTGILILLVLGPPTAAGFAFYRTYSDPSIGRLAWGIAVAMAAALSLRTFLLANTERDPDDLFTKRRSE